MEHETQSELDELTPVTLGAIAGESGLTRWGWCWDDDDDSRADGTWCWG